MTRMSVLLILAMKIKDVFTHLFLAMTIIYVQLTLVSLDNVSIPQSRALK